MSEFRTLIVHPALAPYRVDLFNRLSEHIDMKVVFLNDHVKYYDRFNREKLRGGLKCENDCLLSGFEFLGREFRTGLGKIIDEFKPDVVVSHEFSYITLATALYRILGTKHSFGHLLWTVENNSLLEHRNFLRRFLRKICCKAVDGMLVYSDEIKNQFARFGLPRERIFVCANHQDEKRFLTNLETARSLLGEHVKKYMLHDKKIVLYVGRLAKPKNLPLINAFSMVSGKNPAVILVLVGDGPEKKFLQSRAESLNISNKVLFIGHRENAHLYVWYLLASLFVLPSTREPYGAVVNEALMTGVPVLCSSHAGANVLINDSKNGCLFNPYNTKELAYRINEALTGDITVEKLAPARRENLMPVPFERDVTSFVKAVGCIGELQRAQGARRTKRAFHLLPKLFS